MTLISSAHFTRKHLRHLDARMEASLSTKSSSKSIEQRASQRREV